MVIPHIFAQRASPGDDSVLTLRRVVLPRMLHPKSEGVVDASEPPRLSSRCLASYPANPCGHRERHRSHHWLPSAGKRRRRWPLERREGLARAVRGEAWQWR